MRAATGLAQGRHASPALAAQAVRMAMDSAGLEIAQSVVLYLSSDFSHNAHDPQAAISAAARAAQCTQVVGCTAAGVFTETDWILDAPAAAALVLGNNVSLQPARPDSTQILTYSAPNALDLAWLQNSPPRFGGVSGDATGQGPFSVWQNARIQESGRSELTVHGANLRVDFTQGVHPLSPPARLTRVAGHDVQTLGGITALASLARELPLSLRAPERIPTHQLMAGIPYGAAENALVEGRFHLLPVVSVNSADQSVTIAGQLETGMDLFWALRKPNAAADDMAAMLTRLSADATAAPRFGLMFPCMGRGPMFFGGVDRDQQLLAKRFPGLPFIGFYGNGEIAHFDGANRLLQYSTVLALGYEE
jgi:small ligand-binding sensory domain FIST